MVFIGRLQIAVANVKRNQSIFLRNFHFRQKEVASKPYRVNIRQSPRIFRDYITSIEINLTYVYLRCSKKLNKHFCNLPHIRDIGLR